MGTIADSPLGQATHYPDRYDPGLLYAVERAPQREALGISAKLPFWGVDRWTAWELMWLAANGAPQVGIASFLVPCESPRIVESKSVKLWLTSLNFARLDTPALRETLVRDLSTATGSTVAVEVDTPDTWERYARHEAPGESIDEATPGTLPDAPDRALLRTLPNAVDETLVSHAFRSMCPVTGAPDYASISVSYRGRKIDHASLAAYLAGYRRHPGFHEHCVERIYVDLLHACLPLRLAVEARFTRRGGVDINPLRSNHAAAAASPPALRQ